MLGRPILALSLAAERAQRSKGVCCAAAAAGVRPERQGVCSAGRAADYCGFPAECAAKVAKATVCSGGDKSDKCPVCPVCPDGIKSGGAAEPAELAELAERLHGCMVGRGVPRPQPLPWRPAVRPLVCSGAFRGLSLDPPAPVLHYASAGSARPARLIPEPAVSAPCCRCVLPFSLRSPVAKLGVLTSPSWPWRKALGLRTALRCERA